MTRVFAYVLFGLPALAQSLLTGGLTRVAGIPLDPSNPLGDGGPAYNASFVQAQIVARDSAGNLYVADNARVRKIDTRGLISTIANIQANGIAIDSAGTVYVSAGFQIDRIGAGGALTPVAGNGSVTYNGEGIPALSAGMSPQALAIDSKNQLYFADGNGFIRVLRSDGRIYTVPGGSGLYGTAMAFDGSGNLYVAAGERVLALNLQGGVVQWAGTGAIPGGPPPAGVLANTVALDPMGLAADAAGDLFLTSGGVLYKVTADGILRLVAGLPAVAEPEACDLLQISYFAAPVAADPAGNAYFITYSIDILPFTGSALYLVREATAAGALAVIAGAGPNRFSGDGGPAAAATFASPTALAFDAAGNLYVADSRNNRVRRIDTTGIVTTVAGNGGPASNQGSACATDLAASLEEPGGIAFDAAGNLYIADLGNDRIRKIAPDGSASDAVSPSAFLFGTHAFSPTGVAVDAPGRIYVADSFDDELLVFSPAGALLRSIDVNVSGQMAVDSNGNLLIPAGNQVWMLRASDGGLTAVAGTGDGQGRPQDLGTAAAAAADSAGNIYAAAYGPAAIQRTTRGCVITAAQPPQLVQPSGIAIAANGDVYISDAATGTIWKATPAPAAATDPPTPALGAYHPITNAAPAVPPQQFEPNPFSTTAFFPQEPAAPGEIVLIHGICLAPFAIPQNSVNLTGNGMLPLSISGVSVTMNGIPMPLFWVTESTIEAQVPYEEPPVDAPASNIAVTFNGVTALFLAPVVLQYPALFTTGGASSGFAVTLNQDGGSNSAQNPAKAGTMITVFGSGFGAANPQVAATGQVVPASPLEPIAGVSATIAGVSAPVLFAGDAPRLIGVTQINLQVPAVLPSDGDAALTVTVAGVPLQQGQILLYVAR